MPDWVGDFSLPRLHVAKTMTRDTSTCSNNDRSMPNRSAFTDIASSASLRIAITERFGPNDFSSVLLDPLSDRLRLAKTVFVKLHVCTMARENIGSDHLGRETLTNLHCTLRVIKYMLSDHRDSTDRATSKLNFKFHVREKTFNTNLVKVSERIIFQEIPKTKNCCQQSFQKIRTRSKIHRVPKN